MTFFPLLLLATLAALATAQNWSSRSTNPLIAAGENVVLDSDINLSQGLVIQGTLTCADVDLKITVPYIAIKGSGKFTVRRSLFCLIFSRTRRFACRLNFVFLLCAFCGRIWRKPLSLRARSRAQCGTANARYTKKMTITLTGPKKEDDSMCVDRAFLG